MQAIQPLSEDFLYWNPEEICVYPEVWGIEQTWFINEQQQENENENTHQA